jgi:hypothetical protein
MSTYEGKQKALLEAWYNHATSIGLRMKPFGHVSERVVKKASNKPVVTKQKMPKYSPKRSTSHAGYTNNPPR